MLGSLTGGIGLFLLGIWLMTDGLKLASGHALRKILTRSTNTALRGIKSGALITSLVQSSGAVIVATIGFVNAGLLTLGQAIMVTYGSNIGTTMTSWLVALIGFHFKISAFALPTVGIGMLIKFVGGGRRHSAAGQAIAGFGIFFLGIGILKTAFAGLGGGLPLAALTGSSPGGMLLSVGIGFILTFFMQSSSAAMAIILTAAGNGVIEIDAAAAMVIGTNVGTTTTATFAALRATPNAKRVAAAHVAFNLITGVLALLLLIFLLTFLTSLHKTLLLTVKPATLLAIFHTAFNILGVTTLLPFTGKLVNFLNKTFRIAEEDEASPRYLDRNVATTPILAIQAMAMELGRIGIIARRMAISAMSSEIGLGQRLRREKAALESLVVAVGEFSTLMQRSNLPAELDDLLPSGLRVSRYYIETAGLAGKIAEIQSKLPAIEQSLLAADIAAFKGLVVRLLKCADVQAEQYSDKICVGQLKVINEEYQQLKAKLLRAGTTGQLQVRRMVEQLELLSVIHRIADQTEKGARYLNLLKTYHIPADREEDATGEPDL